MGKNKIIGISMILILIISMAVALTGCIEEEEEGYTLNVNVEGSGTVDIDPDQEAYENGTEVQLIATPDDEWSFSHWEGDVPEKYEDEITVFMDENKTITAHFDESDTGVPVLGSISAHAEDGEVIINFDTLGTPSRPYWESLNVYFDGESVVGYSEEEFSFLTSDYELRSGSSLTLTEDITYTGEWQWEEYPEEVSVSFDGYSGVMTTDLPERFIAGSISAHAEDDEVIINFDTLGTPSRPYWESLNVYFDGESVVGYSEEDFNFLTEDYELRSGSILTLTEEISYTGEWQWEEYPEEVTISIDGYSGVLTVGL